jgi:hypothetical protein
LSREITGNKIPMPGVTGFFIWRQIDDQRQRSLVTGADLVLRTMEVDP